MFTRTESNNGWLCFYTKDDEDVPVVQYNMAQGKMINKWGTISLQCVATEAGDIVKCATAVVEMDRVLSDFLA
jgi:hypothetical protein